MSTAVAFRGATVCPESVFEDPRPCTSSLYLVCVRCVDPCSLSLLLFLVSVPCVPDPCLFSSSLFLVCFPCICPCSLTLFPIPGPYSCSAVSMIGLYQIFAFACSVLHQITHFISLSSVSAYNVPLSLPLFPFCYFPSIRVLLDGRYDAREWVRLLER